MAQIKCIGRRTVEVAKIDNHITLVIYWKGKRMTGLQFEKEDVIKLVGDLNGIIRFDTSKK